MKSFENIPGYGVYKINKSGDVLIGEKVMNQYKNNSGYLFVMIYKNRKRRTSLIHRLLALTFIPNPNNLPVVNHKDFNKLNNSLQNLEWCTQKYNLEHSVKLGNSKPLSGKGEKNGFSKLISSQIIEIREMYKTGKISQRKIAALFNIKQTTVANIVTRKNWNHI